MNIKRIIYLGYYLKELDFGKVKKFERYALEQSKKNRLQLWHDVIFSSLKYNISILDYFYFRFYSLNKEQRRTFAGTGFMYEFQLRMNPKHSRRFLEDKILFLEKYRDFIFRKYATINNLRVNSSSLLSNPSGKLVLKGSKGQIGAEVEVVPCSDYNQNILISYMKKNQYDLIEEYVVQHGDLMRLSPSGLNTVRIFTQIAGTDLIFLGARLRITINSTVDNMAAGNVAAPVDISTGKVNGPAVYSDITKKDVNIHPITRQSIEGFQIPFWEETLTMIKKAAFLEPANKSVGWDIAISENGPELIEGNHNWCKLLWQLPVKKGLKSELDKLHE